MSEELEYDSETRLVRIRLWGEDPIEDWIASKQEVIRLHESKGASKVLFDVRRQEAMPSVMDIFEFGERWPESIRVAIVMGPETSEDVTLLETGAINRAEDIRVFFDEDEALLWLEH